MEEMRQDAKPVNFGLMFGSSARTFVNAVLETRWTEQQCDDYIESNNLYDLKDQIIARNPRDTPVFWKYLTCASDIRNKFFNTYKGLKERIDRERVFAYQHGYVRSWHGQVRRIPELFIMDHTDAGRPSGDDNSLYSRVIGNLQNIASNTSIQNFEASIVMPAIIELHMWFHENKMKSFIWNSVHDSIDLCIYRPELDIVAAKIKEVCTDSKIYKNLGLFKDWGLNMDIDMMVADLTDPNEYYKGGKKYKFKDDVEVTPSTKIKIDPKLREMEEAWFPKKKVPTRKVRSQKS